MPDQDRPEQERSDLEKLDQTTEWLVVSDLDGTLLNHHDYAFDAAKTAIAELKHKGIPVVLNTSKTYAETVTIREQLGIGNAFIVENGSCLYLPVEQFDRPQQARQRDAYWELVLGATQEKIDDALRQLDLGDDHCIRLSRCSVAEAVALTGLTEVQAEQAIAREFSEPLIWQAGEPTLAEFQQQLHRFGLTTLQGGRFLHVIGECDKGLAMRRLAEQYDAKVKLIALGDSANDAAMLNEADISIIVNSPSNHQLRKLVTADIQTDASAPAGWRQGIDAALNRIYSTKRY